MSQKSKRPSKRGANQQTDQSPKLFVRQVILFSYLWALLFGMSQIFPIFGHEFILPSIVSLLLSFIIGPLGIRRALRNNSATKKNANVWTIPMLVFGVILCGFLVYRTYRPIPAKLSVDVGETFDRKNPFETRFTLGNDGPSDIYCVFAHMRWLPLNRPLAYSPQDGVYEPQDGIFTDTNQIPRLASGAKHTCHFNLKSNYVANGAVFIELDVAYKPVRFLRNQFTNAFQFMANRDSDGNYHLLHFDAGNDFDYFVNNPSNINTIYH